MEKGGAEVSFNRNLQFMMDQRLAGGGNGENSRAEDAQPKAFFVLHSWKGETGLTGRSAASFLLPFQENQQYGSSSMSPDGSIYSSNGPFGPRCVVWGLGMFWFPMPPFGFY